MKQLSIVQLGIGIFLILLGISIFVDMVFGINLPIGRLFFGFLLCYLGYYIIIGNNRANRTGHFYGAHKDTYSTTMGSSTIKVDQETIDKKDPLEYSITLGSTVIDLSSITPSLEQPQKKHTLIIDTVMGKTIVKINKHCPFCIHAQGTLSSAVLPDGSIMTSGTRTYCSHDETTTPVLDIHARTVLGALEIRTV